MLDQSVTIAELAQRGFPEAIVKELVHGSAISPEMIMRFGVEVITDAREASKRFGRRRQDWEDGRLPAWAVRGFLPFHRDAVVNRAKPRRPFEDKQRDGTVKLAKYAQPKDSGTHVFYGVLLRETNALNDVSIPVWITEGEKKCMAAESAGLVCLALFGVNQWHVKGEKRLHPELAYLKLDGRTIYLAFDRDSDTNYRVRRQELEFGRVLEAAGARVRVVRFPADAPKLDDFLAAHDRSEIAELIADAEEHGQLPPDATAPTDEWRSLWPSLRIDPATEKPVKDADNVALTLLHHPKWEGIPAYDVRRGVQVFLRAPPFASDFVSPKDSGAREVDDDDATRIAAWLVAETCLGWLSMPKTTLVEQALSIACKRNRFDGVADYLRSLTWDGKKRLDMMAVTHLGADDTQYSRTIVAKWMLSAVARARTPGCQADHVLVLEGAQGIRKTSALRALASREYFSDSLPTDLSSRDAAEHLCGVWIVELSELAALSRSAIEEAKNFLTRKEDRFRPAYGRRTITVPRRCVFAGTTNTDTYLKDTTGNRRFWSLACGVIDLEAIERDRDQLWAEALVRVRAGEPWHITDQTLLKTVADQQEERREEHPWEDRISQIVEHGDPSRTWSIAELLTALHAPQAQWQCNANVVSGILKRLGWTPKRLTNPRRRVWIRPEQHVTGSEPGQKGQTRSPKPQSLSPVDHLTGSDRGRSKEQEKLGLEGRGDAAGEHERHRSAHLVANGCGHTRSPGQAPENSSVSPTRGVQPDPVRPGLDRDDEGIDICAAPADPSRASEAAQ